MGAAVKQAGVCEAKRRTADCSDTDAFIKQPACHTECGRLRRIKPGIGSRQYEHVAGDGADIRYEGIGCQMQPTHGGDGVQGSTAQYNGIPECRILQVPSGTELGQNMARLPVGHGIEDREIECAHDPPLWIFGRD
ncbi:hypothetical protein DSECCO2_440680 [anaerobic digester metagenome]